VGLDRHNPGKRRDTSRELGKKRSDLLRRALHLDVDSPRVVEHPTRQPYLRRQVIDEGPESNTLYDASDGDMLGDHGRRLVSVHRTMGRMGKKARKRKGEWAKRRVRETTE